MFSNLLSLDKRHYYILRSSNDIILDQYKTYNINISDYDEILVKKNTIVELIFPKDRCNFDFLNKIWFVNDDAKNEDIIYVEHYYIDFYNESSKQICKADFIIKNKHNFYKLQYEVEFPQLIIKKLKKENN